jgi:lambda repressor-like predicted transcriptional regulator
MKAKLTPPIISQIFDARKSGKSLRIIGKEFGITAATVRLVCLGRSWKHLLLEPVSSSVNLPNAKITREQAEEIRQLKSQGWTLDELATKYGLSRSGVCRTCKGNRWKSVRIQSGRP